MKRKTGLPLNGKMFLVYQPVNRWMIETGIHSSYYLHFDSSDDDAGGGFFMGLYSQFMIGWKHIKLGSKIMLGRFKECSNRDEFGVLFSPVLVKFSYSW